jgi:hypothetical protein
MTRIGGFLTPFLVENSAYSLPVVGIVLGVLNVVAGGCAFCVPETKGLSLDAASRRADINEGPDEDIHHCRETTHKHIKLHSRDIDEDVAHQRERSREMRIEKVRVADTRNLLHRPHTFTPDTEVDGQL